MITITIIMVPIAINIISHNHRDHYGIKKNKLQPSTTIHPLKREQQKIVQTYFICYSSLIHYYVIQSNIRIVLYTLQNIFYCCAYYIPHILSSHQCSHTGTIKRKKKIDNITIYKSYENSPTQNTQKL